MRELVGQGRAMLAEFNVCWALCQRVTHVLVALGEKLLLFIRAGQRVAAVVCTHVQGGIHWVGEVGGLRSKENYMLTQRAGEKQRFLFVIWKQHLLQFCALKRSVHTNYQKNIFSLKESVHSNNNKTFSLLPLERTIADSLICPVCLLCRTVCLPALVLCFRKSNCQLLTNHWHMTKLQKAFFHHIVYSLFFLYIIYPISLWSFWPLIALWSSFFVGVGSQIDCLMHAHKDA